MLDLIHISSLREKVRRLEGEQAPGAVSDSTARERYVPWTRPVKSSAQKGDLDRHERPTAWEVRSHPAGQIQVKWRKCLEEKV
jgi:hypothetical protein